MAPTISAEAVQRARAFVAQNGRPLDRAYLDHRLAATADSAARVVAELTKFQTVEGGFGRALEPDVRTPAPSAIATSIAFQYLRGIEPWAPADMAGLRFRIWFGRSIGGPGSGRRSMSGSRRGRTLPGGRQTWSGFAGTR